MKQKFICVFGAIVAITGLASSVQPQIAAASNSKTKNVNLSDDFLVGIESRTIEDDYRLFFKQLQNISSEVFGNIRNYNAFSDGDDGVWQIDDDVRLLVNEPLVERNNILTPPRRDFYEGIDRVEVQTELFE